MSTARELFEKGEELFRRGEGLAALASFEKSCRLDGSNPLCKSYVALLSATERGQLALAIKDSEELLAMTPGEPLVYLNLARLYIMAGRKKEAVNTLRKGVAIEQMPEIIHLLESAGLRKKPVFPFLPRQNFFNKYTGLLLTKLGFR